MIAYFILVHRYPKQFKKLFKSIYEPQNHYLIHVDKRAGEDLKQDIEAFLKAYPNSAMLTSQNVVWGGYSMVEAELRGMKKLLDLDANWDFFINLSGQDFPIKSNSFINQFLSQHKDTNFVLIANQLQERPNTMNRIENYFEESQNGFVGVPSKRAYLENVTPYIGGQWKILSRKCCEFICTSSEVARFEKYYKHTLIADEGFFQTLLMNSSFRGTMVNDDQRAIIWIPDINTNDLNLKTEDEDTESLIASGKIKLRPKVFTLADLPYLLSSSALFARKFDLESDPEILNTLEGFNLETSEKKVLGVL